MVAPVVVSWVVLAINPKFLVPSLALIGALLAGALVIALFRRWQTNDKPSLDAAEELARYRALYEQGAISEEEYHRLRTVLGEDLRRAMHLPAKAPKIDTARTPENETGVQTPLGTSPGSDVPPTPSDGIRPVT